MGSDRMGTVCCRGCAALLFELSGTSVELEVEVVVRYGQERNSFRECTVGPSKLDNISLIYWPPQAA